MADTTLQLNRDATAIAALLASPEIAQFIADLNETRWTGRPGYPIRVMVGVALVKSMYVLPTWSPPDVRSTARSCLADHQTPVTSPTRHP